MRDELNQMMQNGHFCPSANLKAKLVSIGGSAKEWKAEYEAMSKHRKKLSTWVLSANTILVRQADFIKAIKRQKREQVDSLRRHLKCIQGSGAVDDPPRLLLQWFRFPRRHPRNQPKLHMCHLPTKTMLMPTIPTATQSRMMIASTAPYNKI